MLIKVLWATSLTFLALNADITLPQNFESDFHQTITNDKNKKIHYEGSVAFKYQKAIVMDGNNEREIPQSLFKWNYTSPTEKEVCSDGQQITVVDHDLEQVSRYIIDNGVNLEAILKRAEKISLVDYKALYKEVEYLITLDEKNQLKKILYVDDLDNTVTIVFDEMIYNTEMFDERKLECSVNNDYDLIEE